MIPAHFVLVLPRYSSSRSQIARVARPRALIDGSAWLWTNRAMPDVALGERSFIIGHCFSRRGCSPSPVLLPDHPDAGAAARALLRQFWGAYLLCVIEPRGDRWRVMSDPSGLLPVFRLLTPDHAILSSDPALLQQVCGSTLAICWKSLHRHLMYPDLRQRGTCLAGVDELPLGVSIDPCEKDAAEEAIWVPGVHPAGAEALSFEAARDELRSVSIEVLAAWESIFGPLAVALSGGVDSSFVCGALAAAGRSFGCVTLATSESGGDERHFAGLVAKRLGKPLVERIYDPAALHPDTFASRGLPRPSRRTFVDVVDRMLAGGAAELGASVVVDGNSGDNLFCYLHSAAPVVDRLRHDGPGRGTMSTLLDMCRVTGCDVPTMMRHTLRRLRRHSFAFSSTPDARFLSVSASHDDGVGPLVGWPQLDHVADPGKRDHIELISRGLHHIHGISGQTPRFSPLMSQPVLETCLSIPSWLWPKGGVNRALARSAFAAELPPELRSRTAKPGPDAFIRKAFELNRRKILDLLRGGLLAENGVLDLAQIDRFAAGEAANDWNTIRRILDLAEAENWARSWRC